MLRLTANEIRTVEDSLNELYGHLQDNCWPPKELNAEQLDLLKRITDARLDQQAIDSFDPQI